MYDVRKTRPPTCLHPDGMWNCGATNNKNEEGCFCIPGCVRTPNQLCKPIGECGCLLPDKSAYVSVRII